MSQMHECEVCAMRFNTSDYWKCPSCKTPYIDPRAKEIADACELVDETFATNKSNSTSSATRTTTSRTNQPSDALVAAQNRTTHAVRALAITFVAAPVLSLVVGGFMFYALSTEEPGLIILSGVMGVAAFGWILFSSLGELAKSKVR